MSIPPLSASTLPGLSPHFSGAGSSVGMSALQQARMRQINQIASDAVNSVVTNLRPDTTPPQTAQQKQAAFQELSQKLAGADAFIGQMHLNPLLSAGCGTGQCAHPHHTAPLKTDAFQRKADIYPVTDKFERKAQPTKPHSANSNPASTDRFERPFTAAGFNPAGRTPMPRPAQQIPPEIASGTLFDQLIKGITDSTSLLANTLSGYYSNPAVGNNHGSTPLRLRA